MERSTDTVTLVVMPTTEDSYLGLLITGCGAIASYGGPFPSEQKAHDWAAKAPLAPCSHAKPGEDCLRSDDAKRELGGGVFRLAGLSSRIGHGLWGMGLIVWRLFACQCPSCIGARKALGALLTGSGPSGGPRLPRSGV